MTMTWMRMIDLAQPPPSLKTVYHVSSLLFLSLFFFRNEDIALFKLGGWEGIVSACLTLCFYVFFLGLFLKFLGFMTMFLLDLE